MRNTKLKLIQQQVARSIRPILEDQLRGVSLDDRLPYVEHILEERLEGMVDAHLHYSPQSADEKKLELNVACQNFAESYVRYRFGVGRDAHAGPISFRTIQDALYAVNVAAEKQGKPQYEINELIDGIAKKCDAAIELERSLLPRPQLQPTQLVTQVQPEKQSREKPPVFRTSKPVHDPSMTRMVRNGGYLKARDALLTRLARSSYPHLALENINFFGPLTEATQKFALTYLRCRSIMPYEEQPQNLLTQPMTEAFVRVERDALHSVGQRAGVGKVAMENHLQAIGQLVDEVVQEHFHRKSAVERS